MLSKIANLSQLKFTTNMKVLLGLSTITLFSLIYMYIKKLFKPKKLEGLSNLTNENNITSKNNLNSTNSNLVNSQHISLLTGVVNLLNDLNNNFSTKMDILNDNTITLTNNTDIVKNNIYESIIPRNLTKKKLYLSSKDVTFNKIDNIYLFNLSDDKTLPFPIERVINIRCISVQIPYIPHNIYKGDTSIHNKLKFNTNTNNITIPEGQYTIFTLINTINILQTDAKLTFNSTTKYINILAVSSNLEIKPNEYPLFKRLGFNEEIFIDPSASFTATNLPDLSIHYIDVISDSISKSHSESTLNKNNILMRIPFNKAPGDIIYHVVSPSEYNSHDNILPEGNSLLSNIEISFQRPDGTIYDLKGLDFTIKLEISTCDPTIVETFTNLN